LLLDNQVGYAINANYAIERKINSLAEKVIAINGCEMNLIVVVLKIVTYSMQLESNIRGVAFSASWLKPIDDWPVESPGPSTGASRPAQYQKRGVGEGVAEDVHWHPNLVLLLMRTTAGLGGLEEIFQNVLCRGGLFYIQP